MKIRLAILAVLLGGCAAENQVETATPLAKSHVRTCADETVVVVKSATEPAPGMTWSPRDVLRALDEDFEGIIYWETGGESPAVLDAASRATEVRAIYPADSANGLVDARCPPYYTVDMGAAFLAEDGRLDELFSVELIVTSPETASFAANIPLDQLQGELRPTEETTGISLGIDAEFGATHWEGSLYWLEELSMVSETVAIFAFD
ncbi:MAG: hypothetical protein HN348_02080 [Proteobacteria bacterium]|jgi:hypothetical protein|nr:hypothetical protein [Pseudomonadota bacterium]